MKVLLSFFFSSFFYQVHLETKFMSFEFVRERAAASLRHCTEDEVVRQREVSACVCVCEGGGGGWGVGRGSTREAPFFNLKSL